jgi:exodeoxyribonuclease V alpha subunit
VCDAEGTELSPEQKEAVALAVNSRATLLLGGPGRGKTFATQTIVRLWRAMGKEVRSPLTIDH